MAERFPARLEALMRDDLEAVPALPERVAERRHSAVPLAAGRAEGAAHGREARACAKARVATR